MSILTELLRGKITFDVARAKAENWASSLSAPGQVSAAGQLLSLVKQGASDAVMIGESALSAHILPAADAVEAALEAALAKATGGLSVPFNPLIDSGIDQMARVIKQAADTWALQTKARLAANTNTNTSAQRDAAVRQGGAAAPLVGVPGISQQ